MTQEIEISPNELHDLAKEIPRQNVKGVIQLLFVIYSIMPEENKLKKALLNKQKQKQKPGLALSQYQPLQMANDAKSNKQFPNKGQIQSCIRKGKARASSKKETNVVITQPYAEISEKFKVTSQAPVGPVIVRSCLTESVC